MVNIGKCGHICYSWLHLYSTLVRSISKNNLALYSMKYELRFKKLFSTARILQRTKHVLCVCVCVCVCVVCCSVSMYKNSVI
jgi:hypothetical protein